MKSYRTIFAGAVSMLALSGCYSSHTIESTHEIKPVEIKPIHITIDLNVKVDKDLDDFFKDIDKNQTKAAPVAAPAAPASVTPAAPDAVQKTDEKAPVAETSTAPVAAPAAVPVPAAPSERVAAIKEKKPAMEARLGSINELKAQGIIGEDNKGFLAFVGSSKEGEDIVKEENADRAYIYAAIAKKQGAAVDLVSSRRALRLADRAKAGEYVQDAKGVWVKK